MILIGGQLHGNGIAVTIYDDAWAFDCYPAPHWTQLTTMPRRYGQTAVYDSLGDRIILFGGSDGGALHSDVYALDLSTNTYSTILPDGAGPSLRSNSAAVREREA